MELNLILFCESFNGNWKRPLFFWFRQLARIGLKTIFVYFVVVSDILIWDANFFVCFASTV